MSRTPNVVYVFSDQHRADAVAYRGNPDVLTPHMDKLSQESLDFKTAVASMPVCCPARASLITGQYATTHGVFVNDVCLGNEAVSIAEAFKQVGYDTAYVGKWHLDGHGRSAYIPKERRHGFDFWQVLECTHDYNKSYYYGNEEEKKLWDGYDAEAQTNCAMDYIRSRQGNDRPFVLLLSWGPPHNPYETAPKRFKDLYDPSQLTLRPNVPEEYQGKAREELAGYYAHITALDECLGKVMALLETEGLAENTILVYTSDHGDMLWSQGEMRKQKPWDESILVPFLLRYPAAFGRSGRKEEVPIATPDLMPTLLGLCGLDVPATVEGRDFSGFLQGEEGAVPDADAALIECIHPFGEWHRGAGGREYRGIRTNRYTFVRDLKGPWLLYDNEADPYQQNNLCGLEAYRDLQQRLDARLTELLKQRNDEFLPGEVYLEIFGYEVDETGTVPYTW